MALTRLNQNLGMTSKIGLVAKGLASNFIDNIIFLMPASFNRLDFIYNHICDQIRTSVKMVKT